MSTGHYTSSPDGDRYIGWVLNRGVDRNSEYIRAEQMKKKLYRPDVIQKVLGNRSLDLALSTSPQSDFSVVQVQEAKVVPVNFEVLSPQDGTIIEADAVNLKVQITANPDSDIDWSVTVNNRQILNPSATRGLARTQPSGKSLTFPLLLDPGENLIRVVADNSETEKEIQLVINRKVTEEVATKGVSGDKLLVISVGVDEYVNLPDHNLRFASADADAIAKLFVEQEGKNYDEVETIILSDTQGDLATRDNIVDALDTLSDLGPSDTVILFLAGHGIIEDSDYYFLPRDATLRSEDRWKKSTVVAWSEIQRAMQASLGRRILLVDTCHAESAFNSRLIKDAEDSNIIVMSSTDSTTLAQEVASLGHGVFTYALVSGIEGEADSFKDGRVTMSELNAFVANAVPSMTQNAQIPTLSVPGGFQDFVIASLGTVPSG
ncbi:MAG: caspase family protein [bacterium]